MPESAKFDSLYSMSASVHIKNLHFSYPGGKSALQGINLDIEPGEKFGIIGPSGAGKSTLLLHLNGILSGEGEVIVGDTVVEKKSMKVIRRMVGLIFQNPDDQLFNPTVAEDIAFGPLNFGYSREEVNARVKEAIRTMNLEGFENLESHHLSMGERQRVALATVLSMSPELIAFDEPFSSLDPEMVRHLVAIINGLHSTVVIVSQSIMPLLMCCRRLAVMSEGRIVATGPTREIIHNDELLKSAGMDIGFYRDMCREFLG